MSKKLVFATVAMLIALVATLGVLFLNVSSVNGEGRDSHKQTEDLYTQVIASLKSPKFFPVEQPPGGSVVWVIDGGEGHEVLSVQYRGLHIDVCEQSQSPCAVKNRPIGKIHALGADLSIEYGPRGQDPAVTSVFLPPIIKAWWMNEKFQSRRPRWLVMSLWPGDPGNHPDIVIK
jgi:hypothetical protein